MNECAILIIMHTKHPHFNMYEYTIWNLKDGYTSNNFCTHMPLPIMLFYVSMDLIQFKYYMYFN